MKNYIYIFFLALALTACTTDQKQDGKTVCGITVHGQTPWQLAADIADTGDRTFIPEKVEIYRTKAYIKGWLDTQPDFLETIRTDSIFTDGYQPAEVVCDLEHGKVTHAFIYCESLEK